MLERRRFEILLPLRYPDGSEVPFELIRDTRRDVQYEFGALPVEAQILQGFDSDTGARRDHLVRLFVDVPDTPENLAFFYKYKVELETRFQQKEIRICSLRVGVI